VAFSARKTGQVVLPPRDMAHTRIDDALRTWLSLRRAKQPLYPAALKEDD